MGIFTDTVAHMRTHKHVWTFKNNRQQAIICYRPFIRKLNTHGHYHRCHGKKSVPSQCVEGVPSNCHGNRLIDRWDIFKVIIRSAWLVFPAARVRNYGDKQGAIILNWWREGLQHTGLPYTIKSNTIVCQLEIKYIKQKSYLLQLYRVEKVLDGYKRRFSKYVSYELLS